MCLCQCNVGNHTPNRVCNYLKIKQLRVFACFLRNNDISGALIINLFVDSVHLHVFFHAFTRVCARFLRFLHFLDASPSYYLCGRGLSNFVFAVCVCGYKTECVICP